MRQLLFPLVLLCLQATAQQQTQFYPSGAPRYSYEFKDGKLNGNFISYYENGVTKAKGSFINGHKTGDWQAWDEQGMLRTKRVYTYVPPKEEGLSVPGEYSVCELVSEWNSSGCAVPTTYFEKKKNNLGRVWGMHETLDETILYRQRYWTRFKPCKENADLFSASFQQVLQKEIAAGKLAVFTDDRLVNNISSADALKIINKAPDEYLVKEEHSFYPGAQKMVTRRISLGLVFNNEVRWMYFPDIRPLLAITEISNKQTLDDKFTHDIFISTLDMTTLGANTKTPRKLDEKERIAVLLSEIDFEATAWVYLLDKDLGK